MTQDKIKDYQELGLAISLVKQHIGAKGTDQHFHLSKVIELLADVSLRRGIKIS